MLGCGCGCKHSSCKNNEAFPSAQLLHGLFCVLFFISFYICRCCQSMSEARSRTSTMSSMNITLISHIWWLVLIISLGCRLDEVEVLDMKFLYGCETPTLAILHHDLVCTWFGQLLSLFLSLSLSLSLLSFFLAFASFQWVAFIHLPSLSYLFLPCFQGILQSQCDIVSSWWQWKMFESPWREFQVRWSGIDHYATW